MNYNYNNNNDYIKQLKHPNNIEILCAEPCIPNCSNRSNHYNTISKSILDMSINPIDICRCPYNSEANLFSKIMTLPHAITNERIEELAQ